MAQTTVFQSGNSQAVRLPKDFRFKSKTVEIFRRGNEVVLREKPRTLGELLGSLPPLTEEDARDIERVFANVRETRPAEERDWGGLFGSASPEAQRSKPAARRRK
jgi:antitoxin VapB